MSYLYIVQAHVVSKVMIVGGRHCVIVLRLLVVTSTIRYDCYTLQLVKLYLQLYLLHLNINATEQKHSEIMYEDIMRDV